MIVEVDAGIYLTYTLLAFLLDFFQQSCTFVCIWAAYLQCVILDPKFIWRGPKWSALLVLLVRLSIGVSVSLCASQSLYVSETAHYFSDFL